MGELMERVKVEPIEEEEEEIGINSLLMAIMEGYQDSVIPPLSDFTPPRSQITNKSVQNCSSSTSNPKSNPKNEMERQRRDNFTNNFRLLQSVIPNLNPKANKEEIVTRAIEYIQRLENERKRLEELKNSLIMAESSAARLTTSSCRCTGRNFSVDVSVSDGVSFFGIQSAARRGLVVEIFKVFEKNRAPILAANVSVDEQGNLTMAVTASAGGDNTVAKIRFGILKL